uniref:GDNF/GAS1 domain-containing protein n=1 Tax=Canis lupus familiaris TaxID=9615 RepID=A0A8C0S7W2_CANLF
MPGRGRGLHGGCAVPAAAHRVRGSVPGSGRAGGCPRARCRRALRRFFSRGPPALTHALLFCPCANAPCAERRRQTFVPACAFSGPGPAPPSCLAPLDACEHSRICRCRRWVGRGGGPRSGPGCWGCVGGPAGAGAGCDGAGGDGRGRAPSSPPPVAPRRPRLLAFQASCAPAPGAPDGCLLDQAPRCLRAYAGLVGTAVTPNYVDNASARVAPWCDCGASGNRREECEAFRGLFTRNRCLDDAIQAFDSGWPLVLRDQLDVHQDLRPSPASRYREGTLSWEPLHCLLPHTSIPDRPGWRHEGPGMEVVEAESRTQLLPEVHILLPPPRCPLQLGSGWELPALHASCLGSPAPALTRTADLGQHHCPILPGVQGPFCTPLPH